MLPAPETILVLPYASFPTGSPLSLDPHNPLYSRVLQSCFRSGKPLRSKKKNSIVNAMSCQN